MMRTITLFLIAATAVCGCAGKSPVSPGNDSPPQVAANVQESDGPYRLYGEWIWYINSAHDRIDVVPKREGRFHLNALKFLESYCTDCLKILSIKNNGDGTIDLTVRITHPFPGHPEFTGFDVKGIVMFNGSHELEWSGSKIYPYPLVRLSWRQAGDPEVLNADGYVARWSPWWDSGSDMPIFNYWPGKYSNGTPTANINAYLNFYTDVERHMFQCNGQVERTYRLYLPPGPVVAGYAVEACWEPPTVTPVIDPLVDFPYSANQPEPYYVQLVINNNEPITTPDCCDGADCSLVWLAVKQWYGPEVTCTTVDLPPPYTGLPGAAYLKDCPSSPPDETHYITYAVLPLSSSYPDGTYRGLSYAFTLDFSHWPDYNFNIVYDVFDFTVDQE